MKSDRGQNCDRPVGKAQTPGNDLVIDARKCSSFLDTLKKDCPRLEAVGVGRKAC